MTTAAGNQAVGAIEFSSARANPMTIGNNSGTNGVLTINGLTLNSVNNVIIRNNSNQLLTLQNNVSGSSTMGVALGNSTNNVVVIDGSGGITISSIISGVGKNLTRQGSGSGILTLAGTAANTYSGVTTITLGELDLIKSAGVNAIAGDGNTGTTMS